jgi:putative endonuclease
MPKKDKPKSKPARMSAAMPAKKTAKLSARASGVTAAKKPADPAPASSTHYAYILKCADSTLYVGATNNLERRLVQHNTSKQGAHYTKIRRPVHLVYSETFLTLGESRRREAELKRLSRSEKMTLLGQNR